MNKKSLITLFLILIIAALLRFNNLNWDAGFHLHPDERFLTMVGNAMKIPASLAEYLNPQISPMNPANIGHRFYVYGTLPVILVKLVATISGGDSYNSFNILGRLLSGFADLLIVCLVYKTIKLLFKSKDQKQVDSVALWGAFFYALAVLPIQLSHFFTVDTFLNLFIFSSFYFGLKYQRSRGVLNLILAGVMMGLAISSKITAVFILPLILIIVILPNKAWKKKLLQMGYFVLILYLTVRLATPYYFQSQNIFDPRPNPVFVENINLLRSLEGKDVWYPPAIQWISKAPVVFSLMNLAFFGLGLPY